MAPGAARQDLLSGLPTFRTGRSVTSAVCAGRRFDQRVLDPAGLIVRLPRHCRAKRCSDAAQKPHSHAVWAGKTERYRRVMGRSGCLRQAVPIAPNVALNGWQGSLDWTGVSGRCIQSCAFPREMRRQVGIRRKELKDLLGTVQRR